jgi:hypothetical protein
MARHRYTETSRKGFGKRLSDSIGGAVVGGLMFIAAFPVLWWNEGRAIGEYRALKEGAGAVVHVAHDRIDGGNEGRLVHVAARVEGDPAVDDTALGVSVDGLGLRRTVEMYQWKEKRESREKRTLGGGSETVTEYRYETEWNDDPIDSSDFRHDQTHANPTDWPLRSDRFEAATASLGAFTLSGAARAEIGGWQRLTPQAAIRFPEAFGQFRHLGGGEYYRGAGPDRPEVGDMRIRFDYQPEAVFSVVARQSGTSLDAYTTGNGRSVLLVDAGDVPPEKMFEGAQRRNSILTWIVRAAGTLGMWLGLSLVFAPISRVLDILPMLGTIGSWGIGIVTGMISLFLSLLTIAVGWIFYRPLLGGVLIAIVVAVFVWSRRRASASRAPPPAMPPPPPPAAAPM